MVVLWFSVVKSGRSPVPIVAAHVELTSVVSVSLTVNVVLNSRKSEGRQRSRYEENDEDAGMDALPGVVGMPLPPGDLLDLEEAIKRLPPGARRVFILHDVEGYKHEEIADMLGVTSGATKAQLHRARLLLREALNR